MKKTIFKYIFLFICLMIQSNNIVAMNNHSKNAYQGTGAFQCDICLNYYKSKSRLNQHKKCVHVEKLFQCTHCPDRFKTKTHLNLHQAVHSKEKPFPCAMCSRSYRYKYSLIEHQKDHCQRYQTQWKQNVVALPISQNNFTSSYSYSLILMENKRRINSLALQSRQQQQALLNYPMPTHNNFTYYPSNANSTIFNDLAGASDYKNINTLEDPFLTLQYK